MGLAEEGQDLAGLWDEQDCYMPTGFYGKYEIIDRDKN